MRAGDGDSLVLAAESRDGQVTLATGQTDGGEQLAGAADLVVARSVGQHWRGDVVLGRQCRQQVVAQEDEADLATVVGQFRPGAVGQVATVNSNRSGVS